MVTFVAHKSDNEDRVYDIYNKIVAMSGKILYEIKVKGEEIE